MPVAGEPGNLQLLRGELTLSLDATLAHRFAGSKELVAGALRESLHADRDEQVIGGPKLLARIDTTPLATQPLPVQQMSASELRAELRAA